MHASILLRACLLACLLARWLAGLGCWLTGWLPLPHHSFTTHSLTCPTRLDIRLAIPPRLHCRSLPRSHAGSSPRDESDMRNLRQGLAELRPPGGTLLV